MEVLDWQNKHKNLGQRLFHILENKLYCDCEFLLGEGTIKCHKYILAASSCVFETMFFGSMSTVENVTNKIEVTDISFDTFMQMIKYIYTNELKISSHNNAFEVFEAAKKYMLNYLMNECVHYLSKNITSNNVLEIYEFAKFHTQTGLLNLCLAEMKKNTSEVLKSEYLLCASKSTIAAILDMKEWSLTSMCELFTAVERWNEAQDTGSRSINEIKELVQKIDFSSFIPQEFVTGPAKSKLLNDRERYEILVKIWNNRLATRKRCQCFDKK